MPGWKSWWLSGLQMDTDRIISLLQLAMAAGRTVRGDGLIPAICRGKARLTVLSSATGSNTKKKILDKCRTYSVPVLELDAAAFDRISHRAMKALAVTDAVFAGRIDELRKDR